VPDGSAVPLAVVSGVVSTWSAWSSVRARGICGSSPLRANRCRVWGRAQATTRQVPCAVTRRAAPTRAPSLATRLTRRHACQCPDHACSYCGLHRDHAAVPRHVVNPAAWPAHRAEPYLPFAAGLRHRRMRPRACCPRPEASALSAVPGRRNHSVFRSTRDTDQVHSRAATSAVCSSNEVTVRPPRRRHPHRAASSATSRSPRPPSASQSEGRSCGTSDPLWSVTSTRTTLAPSLAVTATVTVPGPPDRLCRTLLPNSSLFTSSALSEIKISDEPGAFKRAEDRWKPYHLAM